MDSINLIDLKYVARQNRELVESVARDIGAFTDAAVVALPEGLSLENIERFMPVKNRYTGYFKTHLLDEFARYCKLGKDAGASPVFVDANRMSARRIFDLGNEENPGHCENMAELELKRTPAFRFLCEAISDKSPTQPVYGQLSLVNMIHDWREHITVKATDGKTIPVPTAMNLIRGINIEASLDQSHSVDNFGESSSSMEQIEAKARGDKALPAGLEFKCVPYYGLQERKFEIQISIHLEKDKKPQLKLRVMGRDVIAEHIEQEFSDKIAKVFTDKSVVIGSFSPFGPERDYSRR